MAELAFEEYRRRLNIVDMMLSAHSVLRDRYERNGGALTRTARIGAPTHASGSAA